MRSENSKFAIYEYTALAGKALSSPSRLELLDLLCQGEKSVEQLAKLAGLNVKITSAHLKVLRAARLIEARRDGRFIFYRASDREVVSFWANFRNLAENRFLEIQRIAKNLVSSSDPMCPYDRKTLLRRAKNAEIIVIDVRPPDEYAEGHLPHARSIPLPELKKRLATLDRSREIVAYCRGPYCVLSHNAIEFLNKNGYRASRMTDGVADWLAAGLPIEKKTKTVKNGGPHENIADLE